MVAKPAQPGGVRTVLQLLPQYGNHTIGITQVSQINREILAPLWRRLGIKLGHIRCARSFQMQRAMVFHGDGKDEHRLGCLFEQIRDHRSHRGVANVWPAPLRISKATYIDEFVEPQQGIHPVPLIETRRIRMDADRPVTQALQKTRHSRNGPTRLCPVWVEPVCSKSSFSEAR